MASRKLTALPTATEVTTSDKIYIVDVSDTTESPQGTSKQALISELPSSGITSLTSTDGSIDIDNTDPDAPDLSIGYKELVLLYTSTGELDNGTLTILKQDEGFGTITAERSGSDVFVISDTTPFTANKTTFQCVFIGDDISVALLYVPRHTSGSCSINVLDVTLSSFTGALGDVGSNLYCNITVRVYP